MFWNNYFELCHTHGISPNAVARKCGVSSTGTVSAWKKGALPRDEIMARLADYFQISVYELLNGKRDVTDLDSDLLNIISSLKPEDVPLVKAFALGLKAKY